MPKSKRRVVDSLTPTCPYCQEKSIRVSGNIIYPNRPDLKHLLFYMCTPCKAYVGTEKNSIKPLGRLANAALRKAKCGAYSAYEPMWKSHLMHKKEAKKWLAKKLLIDKDLCNIGMFDIEMCLKTKAVCQAFWKERGCD